MPWGGQSCPSKGADVLLSQGPSPLIWALEELQGWKLQEDADLSKERWLRVTLGDSGGHGRHLDSYGLHGFWGGSCVYCGIPVNNHQFGKTSIFRAAFKHVVKSH